LNVLNNITMKDYLLGILLFWVMGFGWSLKETVMVGLSFEQHGWDLKNVLKLMDSTWWSLA